MPQNHPLIGRSESFLKVMEQSSQLAAYDIPVVIWGERGTGKELICDRLHYLSKRWDAPLIKVNCAAFHEELLASELFGHEPGAFTGAQKRRQGRFEIADGGTLFLDEIATASLGFQEKLLRVIEYQEFQPLGSERTIKVDVRVLAATNQNLAELVEKGLFRADLMDRLCGDVISLPPLRERCEDILMLAEFFAISFAKSLGLEDFKGFSRHAKDQLNSHDWPGNIRELKATIERSMIREDGHHQALERIYLNPFQVNGASKPKTAHELNLKLQPTHAANLIPSMSNEDSGLDTGIDLTNHIKLVETNLISNALRQSDFNQVLAAKKLNITYHQLRNYLRKYPEIPKKTLQ